MDLKLTQRSAAQFLTALPRAVATADPSRTTHVPVSSTSVVLPTVTVAICANGTVTVVGDYPFYASSAALIYVAAMCTAVSWFLVIILLITPGNFLSLPSSRNPIWFHGREMPPSVSNRPDALISGSRPWLQKAAALLVAISLTIASADALSIIRDEYYKGYIDSAKVLIESSTLTVVQVFRVISYIFMLLAQVQTLIRLFPRQKEKLIIKWFGFFLILLDLMFSLLDSFLIKRKNHLVDLNHTPVDYEDAISALSYLFELALALLYAAWVFYYIGTKRRYAFVSSKMPNISLIAVLGSLSVIIPISFFVVDIAVRNAYGWGDFLRWVGGVAASVVVWEWVERIEALEQDEKKDGILGREVFDEDETLGRPTNSSAWPDQSRGGSSHSSDDTKLQPLSFRNLLHKLRPASGSSQSSIDANLEKQQHHSIHRRRRRRRWPGQASVSSKTVVPTDPTPISRADTTSAISTEYAVHYHPVTITPPVKQETRPSTADPAAVEGVSNIETAPGNGIPQASVKQSRMIQFEIPKAKAPTRSSWAVVPNPFKRRKESPPLEIKQAMSLNPSSYGDDNSNAIGVPATSRDETNASQARSCGGGARVKRSHFKKSSNSKTEPTVIPAPPRGHVWAPNLSRYSPAIPKSDFNSSQGDTTAIGAIVDSDETLANAQATSSPSRVQISRSNDDDEDFTIPAIPRLDSRNLGFVLSWADLGDPRTSQDEDERPP